MAHENPLLQREKRPGTERAFPGTRRTYANRGGFCTAARNNEGRKKKKIFPTPSSTICPKPEKKKKFRVTAGKKGGGSYAGRRVQEKKGAMVRLTFSE